ncbi:MAG: hypothetical protein Unbinned4294contig1001_33 [Prokaryotic dsDNA virus sp.]|nr:MAG: hypothetical protein Unbinned4294contig1001_33 [Prokaryotic dsDNA virus sp.]|tara:strand:+ start:911 stop:1129 length:219 start_codon:yes stop_codon:yes gene_type:complete
MSDNYMKGRGETLSPISNNLVKELDAIFAVQEFSPENTKEQMMYHYGQRSVIRFLKHHLSIQQDNILKPKEQ